MASASEGKCDLSVVERRLSDGLVAWVECKKQYCDPDSFRRNLNACIQALRNVTFILQKAMKGFTGFDEWYSGWQAKMRSDRVLRWLVEARNQVVKKGDLKTFSKARIGIVDSWYEAPTHEFVVPPMTPTDKIAFVLSAMKPQGLTIPGGLLRVERRWVEDNLPEWELLEALSHVFGVLTSLLVDAHERLISPTITAECQWFNDIKDNQGKEPPCMLAQDWDRTVWIDVTKGTLVEPMRLEVPVSQSSMKAAREWYAKERETARRLGPARTFSEKVDKLFEYAKLVLRKDGYHVTMAILGYPDGSTELHELKLTDKAAKSLLFRSLVTNVVKSRANSVILLSENWMAPLRQEGNQPEPAEDPERREALEVVGVTATGEFYGRWILFHRNAAGAVEFDEEFVCPPEGMPFLEPLRNAWMCNWVTLRRDAK